MHEGNVLQHLASEVRRKTISILGAAAPAGLLWTPPGTRNHILWHAGHAVWLGDVLCIAPATGTSELPAGWTQTFGQHSDPSSVPNWPARDEVAQRLGAQLERMLKVLGSLDEKQLYRSPTGRTGDSLLAYIVHGLHDEAKHQGEMFLLTKLWSNRG